MSESVQEYSAKLTEAARLAMHTAAAKLDMDPLTLAERLGDGEIADILTAALRSQFLEPPEHMRNRARRILDKE